MSKKNKIVRVKLIANPGAGDITTAAARIEQVTRYLAEGIIVGKGTAWIKLLPGALQVIAPEPGTGTEKVEEEADKKLSDPVSPVSN